MAYANSEYDAQMNSQAEVDQYQELMNAASVSVTIQKYNADVIKPKINETVIVFGGCAYWDGKNWRTRMDADNGIIQWKVKYWCNLPEEM